MATTSEFKNEGLIYFSFVMALNFMTSIKMEGIKSSGFGFLEQNGK